MSIAHKLAIASLLTLTSAVVAQGNILTHPEASGVIGNVFYSTNYTTLANFRDKLSQCAEAVVAKHHDAVTAQVCSAAADLDGRVQGSFAESLQANTLAAISAANAGDKDHALLFATRAVHLAEHPALDFREADAALESTHNVRGRVRLQAGDLAGADQDATQAEMAARNMKLVGLGSTRLRADLVSHAVILQRLAQPAEAKAKLVEAQTL